MKEHSLGAECAAEFLGTFILIAFGAGVVASSMLLDVIHGMFEISVGWGLGVTFAIYAAGGISGAHINPAVTVAFAVRRGFPWGKVIPYSLAQTAGAFAAAAVVFFLFHASFLNYEATHNILRDAPEGLQLAKIFATYPQPYLNTGQAFFSEFLLTAFLLIIVLSVSDSRNLAPGSNLGPLFVGLGVAAIGISFGALTGFAINPARDFGPRLFTALAGWKSQVFTVYHFYFWIPIAGPFLGGIAGVILYDSFIGKFLSMPSQKNA